MSRPLSSMLFSAILFGSAFTQADAGRSSGGFAPLGGDGGGQLIAERDRVVAERDPLPPRPPRAPRAPRAPLPPPAPPVIDLVDDAEDVDPPTPPTPPTPPNAKHGRHHGGGVSVSIHDGKVDISGIDEIVDAQLEAVRENLRHNPNIPPQVRDRVLQRIDRTRGTIDRRLHNLKGADLGKLNEEMSKMGEELARDLEGLDGDLQQLSGKMGKQFGKNFARKFNKDWTKNFNFSWNGADADDKTAEADDNTAEADDNTADADSDIPAPEALDDDAMQAAMGDLNDLALKPAQRAEIARVGAESDKAVAAAQARLEALSTQLHDALEKSSTDDAQVSAYIDQITAQEAAIRKARILGWMKARRVLDDAQRGKVEAASKRHH